MKKLNLVYGDGFPLDQDVLTFMQTSYFDGIQNMAKVIGDKVILSGCVVTGNTISSGWVIYNGEIMFAQGVTKGSSEFFTYNLNNNTSSATYQNGSLNPVYQDNFLDITASSSSAFNFVTDFKRIDSLKAINNRVEAVENRPFKTLYSGREVFANPPAGSEGITGISVDIPDVGTNQYLVIGTFFGGNANFVYTTSLHESTSFVISISPIIYIAGTYNITFDYVIVAK